MSRNDVTGDEIKSKATTEQYRQSHERIFGNKIQRGRWIQHPETGELISASEYAREQQAKVDIFIDKFEAYESPITGEVINNRRKRDYDLKSSGSRQYEGRKIEQQEADKFHAERERKLANSMRETAQRTLYEITHGYRRVSE